MSLNQYSYPSCAVYVSWKSASTHLPQLCVTLESCRSWYVHFASASHLPLHLNISRLTSYLKAVATLTTMRYLTIYVMPRFKAILIPLSLIPPVRGYKQLAFALLTALAVTVKGWNPMRLKFWNLSLMLCLYFARKASCTSEPLCMNDGRWSAFQSIVTVWMLEREIDG